MCRVFSKATTVAHPKGITVIFGYSDQWFTQPDIGCCFLDLLTWSRGFSIIVDKGKSISLSFRIDGISDCIRVFHPSEDGFSYNYVNLDPSVVASDVWDIFENYERTDEEISYDLIQRYKTENPSDDITNIGSLSRFLRMKPIVQKIVNLGFLCEVTYDDNDDNFGDYSVDFSVSYDSAIPRIITGELMNSFRELLLLCEEFSIEGNSDDGILNLYCFA